MKQIEERVQLLGHVGLLHMSNLLSSTLDKIKYRLVETSGVAPLLPTPEASERSSLYSCLLCAPDGRRTYSAKGTFRRHVEWMHVSRYDFRCTYCEYKAHRKDRFRNNLRKHGSEPGEIKTFFVPAPSTCYICSKVRSWSAFFDCVAEHCCYHLSDAFGGFR